MDSQRNKWVRACLCCAGLAVIATLAGGTVVRASLADGSPVPAPHAVLADGSGHPAPVVPGSGTGISGTAVHMDGYTAFYQWGSELALTLGTAYDVTTTTYGESTGGPILPPFADLQWGVNHNVLIDIPAGYIAALPSGCFLPDTSQVECTNTTGPFTI